MRLSPAGGHGRFFLVVGPPLREAVSSVERDILNGPTRGRAQQRCEAVVNKFGGLGGGLLKVQTLPEVFNRERTLSLQR